MPNNSILPSKFLSWLVKNGDEFSQEFFSKAVREKELADQAVTVADRCLVAKLAASVEALSRGAFPLPELLGALSIDGAKSFQAIKNGDMSALKQTETEYDENYFVLLALAKKSILNGTLIVRHPATLAPVGDTPEVRAWCLCTGDDGLPLAVTVADAHSWLTDNGIPVPEWLHAPALQPEQPEQPSTAEQPKGGESAAEQQGNGEIPEYKFRSQELIILEIIRKLRYDPLNLPVFKRGKPWVKAAVRRIAREDKKLFRSDKVFDLAWERLRNDGAILEQEKPNHT
jgi:hypothetical protein